MLNVWNAVAILNVPFAQLALQAQFVPYALQATQTQLPSPTVQSASQATTHLTPHASAAPSSVPTVMPAMMAWLAPPVRLAILVLRVSSVCPTTIPRQLVLWSAAPAQ